MDRGPVRLGGGVRDGARGGGDGESAADQDEVPPDAQVIADLELRTAKVRPSRPVTEETELSPFVDGDDDLV